MSRGCARSALKRRLEGIVEPWKLPFKDGNGALKTPAVYEQYVPVDNDDDTPDAPSVTVTVGKVTQTGDARTGAVGIHALVYAEDSEQGYRDAENLVEAIETAFISDPWLDGGKYKLIGPWETDITAKAFPTHAASLTCSVELPSVTMVKGPDEDLEDII
jgi:hypothetical protein